MPLHLIKLCVGVDEPGELIAWQATRLKEAGRLFHITRMMPRRADEIIAGGSLYWVIRRRIRLRQAILAIEPFKDDDGVRRCRLVFDARLIAVKPTPRRPFQGWRYLKPEDAPPDLTASRDGGPQDEAMRAELAELGLL